MEETDVLLRVNQILETIPVQGTYELRVVLGPQSFRITSALASGKLVVSCAAPGDPAAQTTVKIDSAETLRKLMQERGDQSLAVRLVAQRKLRLLGDMSKVEELKLEMEPHAEAFKCLLPVEWLPNSAARACMNPRCAKPFSILRRRHHCRGCGEIFCLHCAPKTNVLGPLQRTCINCISQTRPAPNVEVSTNQSSVPKVTNHANVDDKAALVYELQVEQAIYHTKVLSFGMMCCFLMLLMCLHSRLWSLMRAFPYSFLVAVGFIAFCRKSLCRSLTIMKIVGIMSINVILGYVQAYGRSDVASSAIWSLTHQINARTLFDATVSLSGFWIKIAQLLSVSPALPEAYSIELSKLHNSVPPSSHEHVTRTLLEEFGPEWDRRIILFDEPPLGCATIAQVHRAKIRLRPEDEFVEGVIKVQHPGIGETLYLDMHAAGLIANALRFLNSKMFNDFPAIFREAAELTVAELDFRTEAENQKMARLAVIETALPVMVPEVFEDLISRRAFAMEFVNGEKITDYVKNGGDAQKIMNSVCEYYAASTLGPIFHVDPHPGNLFVESGSGRLCVLDWGQARRQKLHERHGMARLWTAAAWSSPAAFIDACNELGYNFDKTGMDYSAAGFALGGFRWNSRDTKSLKETRADTAFFLRFVRGMPPEFSDMSSRAGAFWKGPLLTFTKSLDILFDVSTILNVSVSCMAVCALHSYRYLLKERGCQILPALSSGCFFLPSQMVCSSISPSCTLDAQLREILQRHHSQGSILGAQLVVLDAQNGQEICNACIGYTSWMDPKPIASTTLFDVGELSRIVLAFIVMKLVESKELSLELSLSTVWPAAKHLKDITLEQVLAHTAGMFQVYPKSALTVADIQDLEKMLLSMFSEVPVMAAGEIQVYHHTYFGVLLTNILRSQGKDLDQLWKEFSALSLGFPGSSSLMLSCDPNISAAHIQPHMRSYGIEELAEDFRGLQILMDADKARTKPDGTVMKAEAMTILSVVGREGWHSDGFLRLPGCQAFSNASTMANLLLKAHNGKVVEGGTLQNMIRSRKPAGDTQVRLPIDMPSFTAGEFGLGLQLLPNTVHKNDRPAWGHSSWAGSFAFVLPGRRPLVASLILNRCGGHPLAEEILSCLWRHVSE